MGQAAREYTLMIGHPEYKKCDERFVVFMHDTYYPSGGAKDFIGFADTLAEASQMVEQNKENVVLGEYHIAKASTMEIVEQGQIGWEN